MEDAAKDRQARLAALRQGSIPVPAAPIVPEEQTLEKTTLLEDQAREMLRATLGEVSTGSVGLVDLAPKKANWDLKKDLEPKLEQLEEQTRAKIRQFIRERIAQQEL